VRTDAERALVRGALAIFGIGRSIFATNFPIPGPRTGYDGLMRAVALMLHDLSPQDRERFFWRNATAFYRLEPAAFLQHFAQRHPAGELAGEVDAGMGGARRGQREIGEGPAPREMAIV